MLFFSAVRTKADKFQSSQFRAARTNRLQERSKHVLPSQRFVSAVLRADKYSMDVLPIPHIVQAEFVGAYDLELLPGNTQRFSLDHESTLNEIRVVHCTILNHGSDIMIGLYELQSITFDSPQRSNLNVRPARSFCVAREPPMA